MSGIDVHDLAKENLAAGRFPVSSRTPFRLFISPEAHRGMREHARQDPTVEICGVLVGRWERDDDGPFAIATNHIRCDTAASKFAEVTFTHESWAQINREMDTRFANERIIGWYHSHPDFGIFLSDRDCFIHQHFFSGPGQVAYVIDPVRDLEGVFSWQGGAPTPLAHYWIGDKICTVAASQQTPGGKPGQSHQPSASAGATLPAAPTPRQSTMDFAANLLTWLALFLLGYLVAGLQSRWERQMIVEGAVAHYGFNNLAKIGFEQNLAKVREQLSLTSQALESLPESTEGLSETEVQNLASQRTLIANNLIVLEQFLAEIQQAFGLSDDERSAVLQVVAQKHAELRQLADARAAAKKAAESNSTAAPASDQPAATGSPATTTTEAKTTDTAPAAGDQPQTESR